MHIAYAQASSGDWRLQKALARFLLYIPSSALHSWGLRVFFGGGLLGCLLGSRPRGKPPLLIIAPVSSLEHILSLRPGVSPTSSIRAESCLSHARPPSIFCKRGNEKVEPLTGLAKAFHLRMCFYKRCMTCLSSGKGQCLHLDLIFSHTLQEARARYTPRRMHGFLYAGRWCFGELLPSP